MEIIEAWSLAYNHSIKLSNHVWKAWRLHLISSFLLIHLVVTDRLPVSGKNSFLRELSPSIRELNRNSNTTPLNRFLQSRMWRYKLPQVVRSIISIFRVWTSELLLTLIFITPLFLIKTWFYLRINIFWRTGALTSCSLY